MPHPNPWSNLDPIKIIHEPNPSPWDEIDDHLEDVNSKNTSVRTNPDSSETQENIFPREQESSTKKTIIVKVPKVGQCSLYRDFLIIWNTEYKLISLDR